MRRFIIFIVPLWALICLIAFAPARWALGFAPDAMRKQIVPSSVAGSLWAGQGTAFLPKTKWPLTLSYRMNLLAAVSGKPFARLIFYGNGASGSGYVGAREARDMKAEFKLSQLPISDARVQGVAGDVFVTLDELRLDEGCAAAAGNVRTNILTANQNRWQGWSGPILSGPITCDGKAVKLNLQGRDKDVDITLDLHLFTEGRYDMNMELRAATQLPAELSFVLSALGFEEQSSGVMRLREQGDIFQGVQIR